MMQGSFFSGIKTTVIGMLLLLMENEKQMETKI